MITMNVTVYTSREIFFFIIKDYLCGALEKKSKYIFKKKNKNPPRGQLVFFSMLFHFHGETAIFSVS